MLKINPKIIIFLILIALGVTLRLLPHPWNFTPIVAITLFSGVYLGKKYAFSVPILAMLFSDIFLGFYEWKLMLSVYGSFALISLIGLIIKKRKSMGIVLLGSFSASILFFLITNFSVWAFAPWYAKTFSGLVQCYIMAIPFFKNTLLGDLFYVTVFFGVYEIAKVWIRKRSVILKETSHLLLNGQS